MGRARTNSRGYTREQQLVQENRLLKRQVSSLRKQLARLDLDRYENIREAVEDHERNSGLSTTQDLLESLKQEWKCKKEACSGYLEIILFNKIDTTYYYRVCNSCSNRTKSQKYSPDVKGILKNSEKDKK
jgi:hypothetical protein